MQGRHALETKVATVSTTVVGLSDFGFTTGFLNVASYAIVTTWDSVVLLTFDGTDPDATTGLGHALSPDNEPRIIGSKQDTIRLKFIRAADTDAKVTVTIMR